MFSELCGQKFFLRFLAVDKMLKYSYFLCCLAFEMSSSCSLLLLWEDFIKFNKTPINHTMQPKCFVLLLVFFIMIQLKTSHLIDFITFS